MTMSLGAKKVIYNKAQELADSIDKVRKEFLLFQHFIRNIELVEQQELREIFGEELWEILHNDKYTKKILQETEKLHQKIVRLLKNLDESVLPS